MVSHHLIHSVYIGNPSLSGNTIFCFKTLSSTRSAMRLLPQRRIRDKIYVLHSQLTIGTSKSYFFKSLRLYSLSMYTTSELQSQLQSCQREYGKVTEEIFDSDDRFASHNTIVKRFGSWGNGLDAAGITTDDLQKCPSCGTYFANIATHWQRSDCL